MKVVILSRSLPHAGGAEKVIANITGALCDRIDFVVVCAEMDRDGGAGGDRLAYAPAVRTVAIDLEWDRRAASLLDRAARMRRRLERLKAILDREQPDVILSNFTYMWHLVALAAKALRLTTKPLVIRIGNPVWQETHGRGWLYRTFLKMAARWADRFVVNSEDLARDLAATLAVPAARIAVIDNPIPLRAIRALAEAPLEPPLPGADTPIVLFPIVLFVGRLATQKNVPLLLRAFRRVRDQRPARLVLVGTGHAEESARRLTAELGLGADVVFAGYHDNPYKFMRAATVFVLSSDYEGFPSALVEAMAVGCPVISTDCPGGPRAILRGGEDGLLVPVGDEGALAAAIATMLGDPALRDHYAQRGFARAEAFDAPIVAGAYARLFESLVR